VNKINSKTVHFVQVKQISGNVDICYAIFLLYHYILL